MNYTEPMLREGSLKNKVAIVTGGGTGLGKSMVKYFLELGAKVVITSRKQDVLDATIKELKEETGGDIIGVASDVRKYEEVENVLKQAIDTYGGVDILVNNAAGNFVSPTERLSHRAFESIIGIVLQGSVNYTLALGKYWIAEKKPGTVLSIVTTYAFTGSGYVVPSACAKGGVLQMTRSLASEWGKYNIRLNAVAPGPFPTKGAWDRLFPKNLQDKFDPATRIPVGRQGHHQELSNLCAYLVSDFSAYVNGECITIDGGEWIRGAGQFNDFELVTPEMWDTVEQMTKGAK
jgi:NAD(P)-dependent dehydrogenase (short-subunit alcohol dehydrogenase family)